MNLKLRRAIFQKGMQPGQIPWWGAKGHMGQVCKMCLYSDGFQVRGLFTQYCLRFEACKMSVFTSLLGGVGH